MNIAKQIQVEMTIEAVRQGLEPYAPYFYDDSDSTFFIDSRAFDRQVAHYSVTGASVNEIVDMYLRINGITKQGKV